MKYALTVGLVMALGFAGITTGYGQTAMQPTPTTRILAIGTVNPGVEREKVLAILPEEVRETANLYLDGKIDQWWVRQDQTAPLFLINLTTVGEARAILEKLPLAKAKLMEFDYIELGPLTPLHLLLSPGWAKGSK